MVQLRRDIGVVNAHKAVDNDSYADKLDTEVLIIGAGFGGIYLMHQLRKLGFQCKIYEAGKELGGVWHWNCYPGARVDSAIPVYELQFPEIWKDWTWSELYPGYAELRKYFEHVEKVMDIKKDVAFDSRVVGAQFDKPSGKWHVQTEDGRTATAKFLLVATGFAAKRHFPDWKGIENFKGEIHHSSFWPDAGVEMKGKKVAVIGTGSTGIQLAQEAAREGASVSVFQRTPNLCLPMQQNTLTAEEQNKRKANGEYDDFFKHRMTTFAGFQYTWFDKDTFDHSAEEREAFYEERWKNGGFEFWLANYKDLLFDKKANDEAYKFWSKKTRARISDPRKREILAPQIAPHAFGTKRPSLEQNFYELIDRPENDVIDIKKTPIVEVTETGIKTDDGKVRDFDVIALCTGFDAVTGGMKSMGLKDVDGVDLGEKWKNGTFSFLGMATSGFPNMFFLYGAQGPTAFSNGPSCLQLQGDWIVDTLQKLRDEDIKYIDPTHEAEQGWRKKVTDINDKTLFPGTSSWYMGANIPGKPREQLCYAGGFEQYGKECRQVLESGLEGFVTA